MKSKLFCTLLFLGILLNFNSVSAQITIEGYVFEDDNRGYLNEAYIKITDKESTTTFCDLTSNEEGYFTCELPAGMDFVMTITKDVFKENIQDLSTKDKADGEKVYAKVKLQRKPGYLFDVTLAEKYVEGKDEVDAIQGALIEFYNNTKQKEALVLKDHPFPTFQYTLEKGNHYTIMIRKEGFFSKRIEAYVDIDGCILCMDGVSEMSPGVSDNLTAGNELGTLLANIELERAELNKSIEIENIYYDYNSSRIKTAAKVELDNLIYLLKNNPSIIVELGSHTDARGKAEYNQKLSQERAESAVKYIINEGEIEKSRILAKGYGETLLVNGCKDGVKCNDADHQKNRRTEIKIVGYKEAQEDEQSLAQIIEAERFEIMLLELQNQEEYVVPSSGEIPDEIKKQAENVVQEEAKEIFNDKKVDIQEKVEETIIENKVDIQEKVEETIIENKVEVKEKMKDPFSDNYVEEKIEEQKIIVIKEKDSPVTQKVEQEIVYEEKMEQVQEKIELKEEIKTKEITSIVIEEEENTNQGSVIFTETAINVNNENIAQAIVSGYTGYKVEIWKTNSPLPESHEIFTQHGNIFLDVVSSENFSYMLGDYSLFEQADSFMRNFLMVKYPDARVIQYNKGKRYDF